MNILGLFRIPRSVVRKSWVRLPLIVIGLVALCVAVWFGFPMTGLAVMATVWLRASVIAAVLGVFFFVVAVRLVRRRRAAQRLEEALVPIEPAGDGKVLSERMTAALATLKKSGGSTYLYDLPWYVIIGPPGTGKTTALKNSGIEFPLTQSDGVEGFGGTRYCDWWFAEDAILIDTAGRYTTQDSDAMADSASWKSFLDLLKKTRPNQPINGVLLTFSVEDMMQGTPESIAQHAQTVRARLAEVHETLKIDFPVYVLFTKCDLISGFREYFSTFSLQRRKSVWGVTFQTKDRKALTHEGVPAEFDKLISRLSDEVIDRLNEEPDGVSRIAIFGLPGQMAMLRDTVGEFLKRVFEPTRYKTNAILRGFYFTSGTQEGTPIDQVLGAMARSGDGMAFGADFLSGKGKSFFLHDLLTKVIFAERDWVSHDRSAVRRSAVLRGAGFAAITLATVGLLVALGISYWQNATLVQVAQAETGAYARAAADEIDRTLITDAALEPELLSYLDKLRNMPAGYGTPEDAGLWESFGLGQRARLKAAASKSYSDALEKMLRPRLILALEQEMPAIVSDGATTDVYRALKVYLLLGGQGEVNDDAAILAYFRDRWSVSLEGRAGLDTRDQLLAHLEAMLSMDDARDLLIDIDERTVNLARDAIVQLPPSDQAYALLLDGIGSVGLPDWVLTERTGNSADQVFTTRDGADLAALTVPAMFTYEGFWAYFYPELEVVAERLRNDQWVLGKDSASAEFEAQMRTLDRTLLDRYRREFKAAWDKVLTNLALTSLVADKPRYQALGGLASLTASPLLMLVKEVDAETKLTREFDGLEGVTPEALATGQISADVGEQVLQRLRSRTSGVQRILFEAVAGQGKATGRVTGSQQDDGLITPIERIEEEFANWHALLAGPDGQRPMDAILGNLGSIWTALRAGETNPDQAAVMLPQILNELTRYNSQLPEPMAALVNDADRDFRKGATDANLETMNRALTNQITFFCRDTITSAYPFTQSSRSLSIDNFARFFGPGGDMDRFYTEYLNPYVERTSDGLRYRDDSPMAGRLSDASLRQFERAERIRQAFFAGGGTSPQVEITVRHVDSHSTIDSALLIINDMKVETVKNEIPKTVMWPGEGKATALQISPDLGRPSTVGFTGSSWTFIDFLDSASSRQQSGDTLRATFMVGGRNITYDFTINTASNPFTMAELRDFQCPQSLN